MTGQAAPVAAGGVARDARGVRISAVVPAWNEAESLPELQRELAAALDGLGGPWEVIYIDDGSRDGTDRVIERLAAADRPRARRLASAATTARRRRWPPASGWPAANGS